MQQDKIGAIVDEGAKRIAQPLTDNTPGSQKPPNRRGVGHVWKNGPNAMPTIFGSGGHHDGSSALIQTFANRQIEDSCALFGNGDDAIDSNRYQRNQANANTEFNFSQYKSGAQHAQRNTVFPGEGLFTIGSTDGLWSGDTRIRVDPYSDMVDMTTQAVGAVYGGVYKSDNDATQRGAVLGKNPFSNRSTETPNESDEAKADTNQAYAEVEEDDGPDLDYYFDSEYKEGQEAINNVQNDFDTGLRRINTKTSQGRQLEAVATKASIMEVYQKANDSYAQVVKDHMGKAHLNQEQKQDIVGKLRSETSKYQSTQVGVNSISRERSKYYKGARGKTTTTKLNTLLVGV